MRWWIAVNPRVMAVDNAGANDMDLSILPSNTLHIQWTDGRGEEEYIDRPGLREAFQDVIPYAPLFQQFMTKRAGMTLAQAKKIQTELVVEIYDCKRQLPYTYAPAAGSHQWEATDAAVTMMTARIASTQATANGQVVSLADQINANIVNPGNALVGHDNSNVNSIYGGFTHVNNIIGDWLPGSGQNTINVMLTKRESAPGYSGPDMPPEGLNLGGIPKIDPSYFPTQTSIGFTYVGLGPAGNIPWLPLDSSTPVNLTMTEMCMLVDGIVDRQQSLLGVRQSKTNAINALTTIAAVIAYDVTAGWP